jgi:hypothetical protein
VDDETEVRDLPPAAAARARLLLAQLRAARAGLAAYLRGCRDAMGLAGRWSFSEERLAFLRGQAGEAVGDERE